MFNKVELRALNLILKKHLENERTALLELDEDSDEYMERANDLMVVDSMIAKVGTQLAKP